MNPGQAFRKLGVALLGFACALPLTAQEWAGPAALEVRVEDAKGKSVQGAEVALEYLNVEGGAPPAPQATDGDGRCAIGGLAPGAWSLEVRKPGFMSYRAEILVALEGKPEIVAASQHNVAGAVSTMRVKLARARNAPKARPAVVVVESPAAAPVTPAMSPAKGEDQGEKPSLTGKTQDVAVATPTPVAAPSPVVETPRPTPVATPPVAAPAVQAAPPAPALGAASSPEARDEKLPLKEEAAEATVTAPVQPPTPVTSPPEAPAPAALATPAPPVSAPVPSPPAAPAPPSVAPAVPVPSVPTPARSAAPSPSPASPSAPSTSPAAPTEPTQPPSVSASPSMEPSSLPGSSTLPSPPPAAPLAPAEAAAPAAPAPTVSVAAPMARSCFECRPGESALAVAATVAAGGSGCSADAVARLRAAASGEIDAMRDALGSGCALLRVDLPAGARYTGFRYEAEGPNGRAADCLPGRECPIGASRFVGEPIVRRDGAATTVLGLFEAAADRRGTLIVYWSRSKK